MTMASFPMPPDDVVEMATKICRDEDFDAWALVWEGSVRLEGERAEALCFRVARNDSDKVITLYWRCRRAPQFELVGNPGVIS